MRVVLCFAMLFFGGAAVAEPLSYAEFAAFPGDGDRGSEFKERQAIVNCLQGTPDPASCVGVTEALCNFASNTCRLRETAAWERLGFDMYLRMSQALGGASWLDEAHARIAGEMQDKCDAARDGEATQLMQRTSYSVCALTSASERTLNLRWALVAP